MKKIFWRAGGMMNRISKYNQRIGHFKSNQFHTDNPNVHNALCPDFEYNLKNIKAQYKNGVLFVNIINSVAVQEFKNFET